MKKKRKTTLRNPFRTINKIIFLFIVFTLSTPALSYIVLTEKEHKAVIDRMKKNKKIIEEHDKRWEELKKSKPNIIYTKNKGEKVVQKIEIPVYNAKPIVYENIFKVLIADKDMNYFCLKPFLGGFMEIPPKEQLYTDKMDPYSMMDIKLGLKFLTMEPLNIPVIRGLGLNVLVGVRSAGGSLSYTFPKYVTNTSLHFYFGMNYKEQTRTLGFGIGLYF